MHPDTVHIAKNALVSAQKGAVASALGGVLSGAATTTVTTSATHYLFWTTVSSASVISLPLTLSIAGAGALTAATLSAGIGIYRRNKRRRSVEEDLGLDS